MPLVKALDGKPGRPAVYLQLIRTRVVYSVLGALRLELAKTDGTAAQGRIQVPVDHRVPAAGVV